MLCRNTAIAFGLSLSAALAAGAACSSTTDTPAPDGTAGISDGGNGSDARDAGSPDAGPSGAPDAGSAAPDAGGGSSDGGGDQTGVSGSCDLRGRSATCTEYRDLPQAATYYKPGCEAGGGTWLSGACPASGRNGYCVTDAGGGYTTATAYYYTNQQQIDSLENTCTNILHGTWVPN